MLIPRDYDKLCTYNNLELHREKNTKDPRAITKKTIQRNALKNAVDFKNVKIMEMENKVLVVARGWRDDRGEVLGLL